MVQINKIYTINIHPTISLLFHTLAKLSLLLTLVVDIFFLYIIKFLPGLSVLPFPYISNTQAVSCKAVYLGLLVHILDLLVHNTIIQRKSETIFTITFISLVYN